MLAVRELVPTLPSPLRTVVDLRYWGGLTFYEIAEEMKVSHQIAYRWHREALSILRLKLEGRTDCCVWIAALLELLPLSKRFFIS